MDYTILSRSTLFQGIEPEDIATVLTCRGGTTKTYGRGETIYRAGETVHSLGVVLSGSVSLERDDYWGNKSILDRLGPGQVFAETYAVAADQPLMISVVAYESCEILFLEVSRLMHICQNACGQHTQLVRNLLVLSAQKNIALTRKIFHTSAKTIRGRLVSYLSYLAIESRSSTVRIPFNRQQLADYLNVDRSALSSELSKMQREGLLKVEKDRFTLLEKLQEET